MATRRGFLVGLLAAGTVPRLSWADVGAPVFLAAARGPDGQYALHGVSSKGMILFGLPLPGRGHAAAAHPTAAEAVAFARRPGTFAFVIDCATGAVRARLTPPKGRQFNGHGTFSPDGSVLFTSEVVADTSQGRVGLWDTSAYRRIGEWPTLGIGPHDLLCLPDGGLVVANGGIATDPLDRTPLNLPTMRPNLTYLDPGGAVAEQVELDTDLAQNSIRHLALGVDGTVAFALQWQGDAAQAVPLLGLHRRGQAVLLCDAPEQDAFTMQGYAGSIAIEPVSGRVAITSAKGGAVMTFDAQGQHLATHRRADLSGVAATPEGFLLSDGSGAVWRLAQDALTVLSQHTLAWDNHLVCIRNPSVV